MHTPLRAVLTVLALAGLALAGAGAVRATDGPELGGRISAAHLPLVWEMDPHTFVVLNRSTIPVRVTLEITSDHPAGWAVDTEAFSLAVDEARTVEITGAGEAPATISATLFAVNVEGADVTRLRFDLTVRHASWLEQHAQMASWAVLVALVALLAVIVAWRRRRARR